MAVFPPPEGAESTSGKDLRSRSTRRSAYFFLGCLICACAADSMAIGTLKGEQET